MNTNLELIRQKCIEVHGDESRRAWKIESLNDPIRLADVLLAIGKKVDTADMYIEGDLVGFDFDSIGTGGGKSKYRDMGRLHWNLRKDDLNEQSEETIDFLANLLT